MATMTPAASGSGTLLPAPKSPLLPSATTYTNTNQPPSGQKVMAPA